MIKIIFSEIRVLKKDILLYWFVLMIIYSLIVSLLSFSRMALAQVNEIIDTQTKEIQFELKVTNPDEDLLEILKTKDAYNINYCFLNETRLLSNPVLAFAQKEVAVSGNVIPILPKDNSIRLQSDTFDSESIFLAESTAAALGVTTGDVVLFQMQNSAAAASCKVGCIYADMQETASAPLFLLSPNAAQRILHESGTSEKYYIEAEVATYEACDIAIRALRHLGYDCSSSLYSYIFEKVNTIYIACRGLYAMNLVLGIALTMIFISFFTIIFARRSAFIDLLIHQGMPLFKIVLLYWCVVELIHVIVTLTCFPIAKQLTKWISTDFFDTFEFEHQVVSPDLFCFAVIFLVMFCVLSISMFRFWKRLKELNYQITNLKGGSI